MVVCNILVRRPVQRALAEENSDPSFRVSHPAQPIGTPSKGAMAKLDRTPAEQTIPAPAEKVQEPDRKTNDFSVLFLRWRGRRL
jgi:hypothetical protein